MLVGPLCRALRVASRLSPPSAQLITSGANVHDTPRNGNTLLHLVGFAINPRRLCFEIARQF